MRAKQYRKKHRTTTKGSRTVLVGPVQRGRDEILVRLHYSLYRILDGDPSVTLPSMAVVATLRRLNMKVR